MSTVIKERKMGKVKLLTALVALIGLMGCATMRMQTIKCEFDGHTIDRMRGNVLGGQGFFDLTVITLNPQRFVSEDGRVSYSLVLTYHADDWLFIEGPLILLVDGQRMKLGEIGRPHREVEGGILLLFERQSYRITPEQLKKIAYANCVKVKIVGTHYYVKREFTRSNLSNYRRFYEEFVEIRDKEYK